MNRLVTVVILCMLVIGLVAAFMAQPMATRAADTIHITYGAELTELAGEIGDRLPDGTWQVDYDDTYSLVEAMVIDPETRPIIDYLLTQH